MARPSSLLALPAIAVFACVVLGCENDEAPKPEPAKPEPGKVNPFKEDWRPVISKVMKAAGVVADSVPEMEWRETEHKARALIRAAELVEEGF